LKLDQTPVYLDLLKISQEEWFWKKGHVAPDSRRRLRALLKELAVRCDDYKVAIDLLERMKTQAQDEHCRQDFNIAINQLKRRWNSIDSTSIFETLRGKGKPKKSSPLGISTPLKWCIGTAVILAAVYAVLSSQPSHPNPPSLTSTAPQQSASSPDPTVPPALPDSLERSEEVFRAVSPSVVVVTASLGGNNLSQGSGVVVGNGLVATNRHVVEGGSDYQVRYRGQKYPASIAYSDPDYDLCALSVPGLLAPWVQTAPFSSLRTGQRVYTIGAPQGLELSIGDGLVSGIRQYGAFPLIQTSAPISKGSSGGGLFDTSGRLVGITTSSLVGGQQINIAIVSDLIPLLPSRSSQAAAGNTPGAPPPPIMAKDLNDKPLQEALANAKSSIQKSSADWQACTASARAVREGINVMEDQLRNLRSANRTVEYNALVPVHNTEVERLRKLNEECGRKHQIYVAEVDHHNAIVNQVNNR